MFYKKETVQPNVVNYIETELVNDSIKYKDSNIYIDEKDFNIFSVLYLISNNNREVLSNINYNT